MAILAAIDVDEDPDRVVTVGYDMATAYDETLVVGYVMPQDEFDQRNSNSGGPSGDLQTRYTIEQAKDDAAQKAARAVEEALDDYEYDRIDTRGAVGSPAEKILSMAGQVDPGFVVVGGRDRSLARQAIFGSVSQSIVRKAERPVVTIVENSD